ncbi:MAG: alpha/beta fold hydrolase [Gemmatimonadota bacterium]
MAIRARWWWLLAPLLIGFVLLLDRPRSAKALHQAEWLEAGDVKVRAVRAGSGDTTLLLIHGYGESLLTWRAVFDPLALDHRVVAIDVPGFGGSDKPDRPYTLDVQVERLSRFLDRWIKGPVIVVGHSMGGELAATLAITRPDRIVAAVLLAPAGLGVGLGGMMDSVSESKAGALGWYMASRSFLLPDHDPDWLGEPTRRARYSLMTDEAYRRAAARVLRDFDFRALRNRMNDLKQPALVIWGKLDPVIPYAYAALVTSQLPCAKLVTLDEAIHRPQVERPDTVVFEIRRFVAQPRCG